MPGILVGITGPCCSGKTSIVNAAIERMRPGYAKRLITYTTRAARYGERDGHDYHFVSNERFQELLVKGELYEHSGQMGIWYGSSRNDLEKLLETYSFVFAVVDFNGMKTLAKEFPNSVRLGITTSKEEVLLRRLQARKNEEGSVGRRIKEIVRDFPKLATSDAIREYGIEKVIRNDYSIDIAVTLLIAYISLRKKAI